MRRSKRGGGARAPKKPAVPKQPQLEVVAKAATPVQLLDVVIAVASMTMLGVSFSYLGMPLTDAREGSLVLLVCLAVWLGAKWSAKRLWSRRQRR